MLYRHGLVMRMAAPGPTGSGAAMRTVIDRRGACTDHGESPPGAQTTVESITVLIVRGCHTGPVAVPTNDHMVSPRSGRARTDARCGDSIVVGARTSEP